MLIHGAINDKWQNTEDQTFPIDWIKEMEKFSNFAPKSVEILDHHKISLDFVSIGGNSQDNTNEVFISLVKREDNSGLNI